VGLNYNEALSTGAIELHLERLAAAAADQRLEADIGFKIRNEAAGPRHRGLWIGEHGRESRRHHERQRLAVRENGHKPTPLQFRQQ